MLLIATLIASTTYAFAAANTGPNTTAGDGANTVSGYVISNVAYTLNNADPSRLEAVSFTLDARAVRVKAKLSEASSTWYACNKLGGNDWSCTTPGATLAAIDQLRVAASNH